MLNLPILERCLNDRRAHALYLYPTKALINDQAHALRSILKRMDTPEIRLSEVHGDITDDETAAAKANPGQLVLSNPDKLHWMLARWFDWRVLFSRLQFVVIDEVHMYRGAFGSHVAQVLRRLLRRCRLLDAAPQIICASATIGNPAELVTNLTGRAPYVVDRNGAERSRRHVVFWRPIEVDSDGARRAANDDAVLITERAVDSEAQVITFGRSRQQVERMLAMARGGEPPKPAAQKALFSSYRGGYQRADRERIERGLRDGSIRGVFSTTALELGIDIGSVSMAVLTGYPGSRMAFHQQAGRAGRRNQDGHVVYVVGANPLDHYFLVRQQDLLYGPSEAAVVDIGNMRIAEQHLRCMAHEEPLTRVEVERLPAASQRAFERLVRDKLLVEVTNYAGVRVWKYVGDDFPHGDVNIRGISADSFAVVCDGPRRAGPANATAPESRRLRWSDLLLRGRDLSGGAA